MNINPWTDNMVAQLRELWLDKAISCRKIASILGGGITRCAVIGKGRRLGLGPKPSSHPKTRQTKHLPPKPNRNSPNTNPVAFTPRAIALPSLGLSILKVRDGQCRYIAGDDRLCCGHPVKPGKSYCPGHCAIVYQPPKERTERQKAHDAALARRSRRQSVPLSAEIVMEAA